MSEPSSSAPEPIEPVVPDPAAPSPTESAPAPRASFLRTVLRGAMTGLRATSYLAGPLGLFLLIVGLVPTAFGLGAGRGFGLHQLALLGVVVYLLLVLWGVVAGLAVGVLAFLVGRIAGRSRTGVGRSFLERPIRLFPRRRADAEPEYAAVPRPRGRRRWPWLVGVPAFLVLATAFAAGVFGGRYVDRRLAAAIAEADLDDPGWRFEDVMADREPPPEEDDSAVVVAEVVSMMPEGWSSDAPVHPGGPKPTPSEAARALERLARLEPNVRMDNDTAGAVRAELADHADAVELARTVADYEGGEHVLELTPNPIDIPLRETQEARLVVRLLGADVAIRAQDGDIDGGLDSCRAILGVGRSLGDEPMLISKLVRIAIGVVAADSARRVLAQGEPSDEALATFQADLLRESPQALLIEAMRGERAILDEVIRRVRDGELPIKALSSDGWSPGDPVPAIAPWGTLMFDHQRAVGLELMNELQAIARVLSPGRRARWKPWQDEVDRMKKSRLTPLAAALPLLMMPAMGAADTAVTRYEATLGASVILTAAERHRRKTGSWPESAAAIDRAFLAEEPLDPFSGEPFRIERRDGQFLVYSVGPNLKDEHGAFDPKKWPDGGQDDNGTGAWDPALRGRPAPE